jgi:lysozyme
MFDGIIDLSHNNDIDLADVKAAGVVAVIHKATEGATYQDPMYASRRAQAQSLGLLWGAYHFGTAASVDDQIANFMQTAQPGSHDFVALDYESNGSNTMSLAQAEEFIASFEAEYGYRPLIYGSDLLFSASEESPPSSLGECGLWIAAYTSASEPTLPSLFTSYTLWQFTDGTSPASFPTAGVACDRSRFDGTQEELEEAWPLR